MILRPYQIDMIERARAVMRRGVRRFVIQLPTGGGKTIIAAYIVKAVHEKSRSALFTVHRRELLRQTMAAFDMAGVPYGVIAAGEDRPSPNGIWLATIQTLARRDIDIDPWTVIIDECHHAAADSWKNVFARWPDAYYIGLSATPCRLDGLGLKHLFDELVPGPSIKELTAQGYLAPYKLYCPPSGVSMAGARKRMGDYAVSDVVDRVDRPKITGDAIEHYKKYAMGKRALVYTASVEHSLHVADMFCAAGIRAAALNGESPRHERDLVMEQFRSGEIDVLTNCELFTEGLDVHEITALIILRATCSTGLWLQMIGRALRPAPGKECAIILDHVGNAMNWKLGLPDDERTWTLEGLEEKPKPEETTVPVKICLSCFAVTRMPAIKCSECGTLFPVEDRAKKYGKHEGELMELTREMIDYEQRKKENRSAKTYNDLVALGIRRGYKNPRWWAMKYMQSRAKYRQQQTSIRQWDGSTFD